MISILAYYCVHMCISIDCSVEIYGRMSTDLLPTPTKSHYIFNLRDLSKCIQGTYVYMYMNLHITYTYTVHDLSPSLSPLRSITG